jgi:hypothetical protein
LENYVLNKILFISGLVMHFMSKEYEAVVDKELYILKKVNYIPIAQSPEGKVKAEVRVLCVWKKNVYILYFVT